MKTLYESILDNEDVLIDDVKKSANDPIISLYRIFLKNKTLIFHLLRYIPYRIL